MKLYSLFVIKLYKKCVGNDNHDVACLRQHIVAINISNMEHCGNDKNPFVNHLSFVIAFGKDDA